MEEQKIRPEDASRGRNEEARLERKNQRRRRVRRIRNIVVAVLVVGFAAFFAIRFYYPFGEGVKTGQLNYLVHKGVIFKTYEGKLIQSGFRSSPDGISSNEFIFSVADRAVADTLMRMGGNIVELRYKEYFGRLPWRGHSRYIVDSILSVTRIRPDAGFPDSRPPVELLENYREI